MQEAPRRGEEGPPGDARRRPQRRQGDAGVARAAVQRLCILDHVNQRFGSQADIMIFTIHLKHHSAVLHHHHQ